MRKPPEPLPDEPPTSAEVRAYLARSRRLRPAQNVPTVNYAALKAKHRAAREEDDSGRTRDP